MQIDELIAEIEQLFPLQWAAAWDRSGVQVAASRKVAHKVAVGLDPVPAMIDPALAWGADFLLVHHPVALKPELPARHNDYNRVLGALFRHDAWLYAAHTSLDVQPDGPVRWLARELGLENISILEEVGRRSGRWFRFLGHAEQIERIGRSLAKHPGLDVYPIGARILEVVAAPGAEHAVRNAVSGLEKGMAHMISQELDMPGEAIGFGFVGDLRQPMPWELFLEYLKQVLDMPPRALVGTPPDAVSRVACCPGSGASLLGLVGQSRAQVYVTGDLKYHDALAVRDQPFMVVDAGHFSLEERMMREFAGTLRHKLDPHGVEVAFFAGINPFG